MGAYYNEIDPKAAAWLRELIKQGHIADGEVDERSIEDVQPADLKGFTQCHFFAGIGVWSYALRKAGISDDTPLWTGSPPCQSFSAAGAGKGMADLRHLWPAWHHLIRECRPIVVLGEQVEAAIGYGWLDLVQSDMEGEGYAFGAVPAPACGFGAPHIRQRVFYGAYSLGNSKNNGHIKRKLGSETSAGCASQGRGEDEGCGRNDAANDGRSMRVADAEIIRSREGRPITTGVGNRICEKQGAEPFNNFCGGIGRLADSESRRHRLRFKQEDGNTGEHRTGCGAGGMSDAGHGAVGTTPSTTVCSEHPRPTNGFWRDADWLFCRDGKWRPVRPSSFPLAHGAAARVVRLRGYGNAINAEQATAFIKAFFEGIGER